MLKTAAKMAVMVLVGACVALRTMAADVMLENGAEPRMFKAVVTGGQVVTVSGSVHCPGLTNTMVNAVVFSLRFVNRNGDAVGAGTLPEDREHRGIFYANGGKGPCRFSKSIPAPENSCGLEVEAAALRKNGKCRLSDFRIDVVDESEFVGDAFSSVWWHDRFGEWMKGGMSPTSVGFCGFVVVLLIVYFALPFVVRPWILLLASAAFYSMFGVRAWWFVGASVISVYVGGWLMSVSRHVRLIGGCVIGLNLALLVLTKYGTMIFPGSSIVIPLGISFYTLQVMSYVVDVAAGKVQAERNPFKLVLYLTFFPTIMQGPISRYAQLGPQLWSGHRFDLERVRDGIQLALWGAFKKMVIADRIADVVDKVFASGSAVEGLAAMIGVVAYSIQIYADFSGCVDVSRGVAQCLGIDLVKNFNHPYFAESVQDFWRRWHISLSAWLRDYIYIPLGGSRHGQFRKYFNVMLVFAVSGLWHGTGLNFFVWGLMHGAFQIVDGAKAKVGEFVCMRWGIDGTAIYCRLGRMLFTFAEVTFAWIFFRAADCSQAFSVIRRVFRWSAWQSLGTDLSALGLDKPGAVVLVVAVALLLVVSMLQERFSVRDSINHLPLLVRWPISMAGVVLLIVFGVYGVGYRPSQFIYMQF